MPFVIVRNDIVNMRVDAIVNTANPRPAVGSGTDSAIHAKAGPELLEARQKMLAIRRKYLYDKREINELIEGFS